MMQTWARLCSRHNFRKRRLALIIIRVNLHNKLGIKDLQEIKYSLFR